MKKIADFAAVYNVRTAPHGAPDLSPICFAAHMHLNISTHNFGIQEFVGFGNETCQKIFKHNMKLDNGMILVDDAPGLGIEFDEAEAEKHVYKRSYLPVSRLEDGTLWHW
jgi:mannonate dehydratase